MLASRVKEKNLLSAGTKATYFSEQDSIASWVDIKNFLIKSSLKQYGPTNNNNNNKVIIL